MERSQSITPTYDGPRCAGCHRPVIWGRLVEDDGTIIILEHGPVLTWQPNSYVFLDDRRQCRPAAPLLDSGPFFLHHAGRCSADSRRP